MSDKGPSIFQLLFMMFCRLTFCKLGLHNWRVIFVEEPQFQYCHWCGKTVGEPSAEFMAQEEYDAGYDGIDMAGDF